MSGAWVFICGPSGAGKDSVIARARAALAPRHDIVFAQRLITRAPQETSDHQPMSPQDFAFLRRSAALAWHWEAHGYGYGVPLRYAHQVAWGRVVVVNGSREHADGLPEHSTIRRVLVTAPAEQLAERLARRGRDGPEAITQRLARNAMLMSVRADHVILNEGSLSRAGELLQRYLEALADSLTLPHGTTT